MEKNNLLWWVKVLCLCSILLLYSGNRLEAQDTTWILVWDAENNCVKYVEVEVEEWKGPLLPPELLDEVGWNGILPYPGYGEYSEKYPTEAQLQAAKGVGSIRWSTRTGGPSDISGNLTPASQEDPEVIAWRFLEENKVLYGINDPHEELRISVRIDDKYATTIHFDPIYKGVVVANGYFVVSLFPNGVIHSVNGVYYPDINVETKPQISAQKRP